MMSERFQKNAKQKNDNIHDTDSIKFDHEHWLNSISSIK